MIGELFGGITLPKSPDLENARKLDLLVVPPLRRMRRLGMCLDREYLWDLGSQFADEMRTLSKDISSYVPIDRLNGFITTESDAEEEGTINPSSPDQIGRLLFDILSLHEGKNLKRTKAGALSTGKRQLETLRYDHPLIPKVLRYREVSKLRSTYTHKLPSLAKLHPRSLSCPVCELRHDTDQWRVHGEVGTTRAATWRFNHKSPNLGNIPSRTEDGQLVQAGFIAPPGKILVNRDLSQIELRGLAHLSRSPSMINAYVNNIDLHTQTCYDTGLATYPNKPGLGERMAAKRANFGISNGSTEVGLYLQLISDFGSIGTPMPTWITEEWCKDFIKRRLESDPFIPEYFELQWYRARRYGLVWNEFGFCRPVPEVHSTHSWIREAGLRQAQNMPITSLAAGQMKLCMARCEYYLRELYDDQAAWPLMTIHDALMHEVDEDRADEVNAITEYCFDGCMDDVNTGERLFRTPIKSDGDAVYRWVK